MYYIIWYTSKISCLDKDAPTTSSTGTIAKINIQTIGINKSIHLKSMIDNEFYNSSS